MRSLHPLQPGCALGYQESQAKVPRPCADSQPDGCRPAGDIHRDAGGRHVEHHSPVAGRRPGLQVPDVPQAAGHVLLCLCDSGDKSGQTVGHPQPPDHQHGPKKEQDDAGGGVDYERLALSPTGEAKYLKGDDNSLTAS